MIMIFYFLFNHLIFHQESMMINYNVSNIANIGCSFSKKFFDVLYTPNNSVFNIEFKEDLHQINLE